MTGASTERGMPKQDPQDTLPVEQIEDYEIIGELAGREDARTFMARRKADGLEVLIIVARPPAGDQGNALSHLAADTNLLRGLTHKHLLTVVDGRWLGTDAFATVVERPQHPTLEELLSRRDEEFDYARIAAILGDANAVMEWARKQKVVHRAVTPETLFVEAGSDRVSVAFALSKLERTGVPGADADARTIAALARAMLTRSPAAPERAERPLAELRPGLPESLVRETDALLSPTGDEAAPAPGVKGYIARIAMADALKEAEGHLAETRRTIDEQQQLHREQIEKERREHDQLLAAQRKEHERQIAEQAKRFQKERQDFQRELARERKQLNKEGDALAKERAAHARDRAALLSERATLERTSARERERLRAEAAALEAQVALYAKTQELPAARLAEVATARAAPAAHVELADGETAVPVAVAPMETEPHLVEPPTESDVVPESAPAWSTGSWRHRRNQSIPLTVASGALLLVVAASAVAVGRRHMASTAERAIRPARSVILDSAAGSVYRSAVPLPVVTSDTAASAQSVTDWTPPPRSKLLHKADSAATRFIIQNEAPRPVDSSAIRASRPTGAETLGARDSTVLNRDSASGRDSTPKRDTTARPKRDSTTKTDTLVKRDTTQGT